MPSSSKQTQNPDKNKEIKNPDGYKIIIGCDDGSVKDFSMTSETTVHDSGNILHDKIYSMAKTPDNKS